MEDWQKRQEHYTAFQQAFTESGCKYFPGTKNVALWKGAEFWKRFNELGHTSTEIEKCDCWKK